MPRSEPPENTLEDLLRFEEGCSKLSVETTTVARSRGLWYVIVQRCTFVLRIFKRRQ